MGAPSRPPMLNAPQVQTNRPAIRKSPYRTLLTINPIAGAFTCRRTSSRSSAVGGAGAFASSEGGAAGALPLLPAAGRAGHFGNPIRNKSHFGKGWGTSAWLGLLPGAALVAIVSTAVLSALACW